MKLFIRQKIFSLVDAFDVLDEQHEPVYHVENAFFSLAHKLTLYAPDGAALAVVRQRLLAFLPSFELELNGVVAATMKEKLTFLRPRYVIPEYGWVLAGDFLSHSYTMQDAEGRIIMSIEKAYFSWSDFYEVDIAPGANVLLCLCAALAVDAANCKK